MLELTYDENNSLKLDLFPAETDKPPIFIYMHGGGLEAGDRKCLFTMFERLAQSGISVASLDYRMYPTAKFPDFIEDCARAISVLLSRYDFGKITVGGSSAGAYLSMMLLFDKSYLGRYGLNPLCFDGWLLDAGQPTTHFNILRERGLDPRLVRIDEAAPLYHIAEDFSPVRADGKLPYILNLAASNDMTCRLEQLKLLDATLRHFGYPKDRLRLEYMNGFSHCEYNNKPIFERIIADFVSKC